MVMVKPLLILIKQWSREDRQQVRSFQGLTGLAGWISQLSRGLASLPDLRLDGCGYIIYQAGAHIGGYGNMLSPHTLLLFSPNCEDTFEYISVT